MISAGASPPSSTTRDSTQNVTTSAARIASASLSNGSTAQVVELVGVVETDWIALAEALFLQRYAVRSDPRRGRRTDIA